jgi:hypothetical protein
MCHPLEFPARTAATLLLIFSLSGCGVTTQSSVAKAEGPSTTRLRLARPDAAPIEGTWRQENQAIVGSIAFTRQCSLETTRTVKRTQVTSSRPRKRDSTLLIVAGSVLAVAGTGFIVASKDQDDTVYCGSGDRVREGDRCNSLAGSFVELGVSVLTAGAVLGGYGIFAASKKPTVTETPLPPEQLVSTKPDSPCGNLAALDGMAVLAQLPDGALRRGQVTADGSARIELGPSGALTGAPIPIVVDSVPTALEGIVNRGTPLGEVTLAVVAQRKRN